MLLGGSFIFNIFFCRSFVFNDSLGGSLFEGQVVQVKPVRFAVAGAIGGQPLSVMIRFGDRDIANLVVRALNGTEHGRGSWEWEVLRSSLLNSDVPISSLLPWSSFDFV